MGLEHADDPVGLGLAQQSPKGLEDRQIRLRRPVVLEARAARDQQIRIGRRARQKRVEHRGLADARLAGEEHQLALAGAGALEPLLELRKHPSRPTRTPGASAAAIRAGRVRGAMKR